MLTIDEVLTRFPDRSFLIHIKSDDENEGIQLATHLKKLPAERLDQLTVYGGDKPIAAIKERIPSLRTMSKATMKKYLITYMALGWTGYLPTFKSEARRVTYTRQSSSLAFGMAKSFS